MKDFKPVLYAEDDDNDVFLMERAFGKLNAPTSLRVVEDGKLAIAYLASQPPFEARTEHPLPGVLIMDLSMPGKHGLEVLRWIKTQPALSDLPVIVLTSSNQQSDIERAYQLGAKGYFVKPGDPAELQAIVKSILDYWVAENRPAIPFSEFATGIVRRPPQSLTSAIR